MRKSHLTNNVRLCERSEPQSIGTLRNWEQGIRSPRGAARVLLQVVQHNPNAIIEAIQHLKHKKKQTATAQKAARLVILAVCGLTKLIDATIVKPCLYRSGEL